MFSFFISLHICRVIDPSTIKEESFIQEIYLNNNGVNQSISGEDIHVVKAWSQGYSGEGQTIFVIDSGVYLAHPDFKNKINSQLNENYKVTNTKELATISLGAAAASINEVGTVGVAPDASVAANVIDFSKKYSSSTEIANEIFKTNPVNATVLAPFLTISKPYCSEEDPIMPSDFSVPVRIVSVAEDGSKGSDANHFTSSCNFYSITVGSCTLRGEPTYYTSKSACISVVAPSSGLSDDLYDSHKDLPQTVFSSSTNDNYVLGNGKTALSAGQVAGVASLIKEANPDMTEQAIDIVLMLTATKTDPQSPLWKENSAKHSYHPFLGFGRVDAELAVETAKNWNVSGFGMNSVSGDLVIEQKVIVPKSDKEMETPIKLDVTPSDDPIFYGELTLETDLKDLNNMRIFIQPKGGQKYEILSPSNYDPMTANHLIKYDSECKYLRVGFRCLLGEKVAEQYNLYINRIDDKEDYITSVSLNFYLSTIDFPSVTRKVGPNLREITKTRSELGTATLLSTDSVNAGDEIKFKHSSDGQEHSKPFYIIDEDGAVMPLQMLKYKEESEELKLRVPTTIKSGRYAIGEMYNHYVQRISDYFMVNNKFGESSIIKPTKGEVIAKHPFVVEWPRISKIKPVGFYGKVRISIKDLSNGKNLYEKYVPDTGIATIEGLENAKVSNAEVSIVSVYDLSNEYEILSTTFAINTESGQTPSPTAGPGQVTPTKGPDSHKKRDIALIASGSVVFVCIVCLVVILCVKRNKRRKIETSQQINDLLIT